jgi:predicted RNA-binding Zn-ribbon protein involved in translation (DUF1610 family)
MRSPCPHCGHALWSEVRCIQALRFVLYFEEEHSDSHAEHVRSCPECGELLLGHAMAPRSSHHSPRCDVPWAPEAPDRTKGRPYQYSLVAHDTK